MSRAVRGDDWPRGAVDAVDFRDTWSYLTAGEIPSPPSLEEKCQLMRDHFHHMVQFRGEWPAVCEFRKRISWYAKQLHPCVHLKEEMRNITCTTDFEAAFLDFLVGGVSAVMNALKLKWQSPDFPHKLIACPVCYTLVLEILGKAARGIWFARIFF